MTKQEAINVIQSVMEDMRYDWVANPKTRYKKGGSSGNMAKNGLSIEITTAMIDIYIDLAEAPYAPYTNEPWLSKRWNGKPNPNEGWWQRFVEEFVKRLTAELKGELKTK